MFFRKQRKYDFLGGGLQLKISYPNCNIYKIMVIIMMTTISITLIIQILLQILLIILKCNTLLSF